MTNSRTQQCSTKQQAVFRCAAPCEDKVQSVCPCPDVRSYDILVGVRHCIVTAVVRVWCHRDLVSYHARYTHNIYKTDRVTYLLVVSATNSLNAMFRCDAICRRRSECPDVLMIRYVGRRRLLYYYCCCYGVTHGVPDASIYMTT